MGEPVAKRIEAVNWLSLAGDDGLKLVSRVALGEELFGQGAFGLHRSPGQVYLPTERGPVKEKGNLGIRLDLPCLACP